MPGAAVCQKGKLLPALPTGVLSQASDCTHSVIVVQVGVCKVRKHRCDSCDAIVHLGSMLQRQACCGVQAVLQGPRQTFKLPVAEFKQAVRDAENSVNYPGKSSTGLKVRLPIGKLGLAGQAAKKGKTPAPRNRSAGATR